MNRTKLEVIRINEDVIATSSTWAVIRIYKDTEGLKISEKYDSYDELWIDKNMPDDQIEKYYLTLEKVNSGDFGVDHEGYYHVNTDGTIGSSCDNLEEHHPGFKNILK